jgi:hypothetical protein
VNEPPFPPPGQTSSCTIVPSYLYEQYYDDEDLQAFVSTYNTMAQQYASWFCDINLPVYTQPQIAGPLLDWVAEGLYGFPRPTLASGAISVIGPLNTWMLNRKDLTLNTSITTGGISIFATTDDIYKRLLTWQYYTGDGTQYSIRWLKRRIMRFLLGTNGTDPPVANTSPVSVVINTASGVTITIATGGNVTMANATIFKAAVDSAVLDLPFQFTFIVNLT